MHMVYIVRPIEYKPSRLPFQRPSSCTILDIHHHYRYYYSQRVGYSADARRMSWVLLCLLFLLASSCSFIFPHNSIRARKSSTNVSYMGKSTIGRRWENYTFMKIDPQRELDKDKARSAVKADLDKRGLYVFGVVLLLNARFTFMPQEIRTIYTCPSGPNREKSIAEFKATNPDYVCNEPSELLMKYLTAPLVPPPSGDLILAKPLMSTKYGTGENLPAQ